MNQKSKEDGLEKKKEAYIKPDFQYEPVFAVQALQCGKVNTTQQGCGTNPKVS